jgi:hypothetical protein
MRPTRTEITIDRITRNRNSNGFLNVSIDERHSNQRI